MARWQKVLLGILAACGLGSIMAMTNPDRSDYETYAIEQLGNLAMERCDRAPAGLGIFLQGPCRAAISAIEPKIRPMLAATTTSQDFIFFSIYKSDVSIPTANLNAKIESVGIFNKFLIYKFP
jgi:hypothetical protein